MRDYTVEFAECQLPPLPTGWKLWPKDLPLPADRNIDDYFVYTYVRFRTGSQSWNYQQRTFIALNAQDKIQGSTVTIPAYGRADPEKYRVPYYAFGTRTLKRLLAETRTSFRSDMDVARSW